MKKLILPVLLIAGVFACEKMKVSATCGEYDVDIRYVDDADALSVRIKNETVLLNLVPSASGVKYDGVMKNGDKLTLWGKGDVWTMFVNDGDAISCK